MQRRQLGLVLGLLMATTAAPVALAAESVAGAYLAARQASLEGDYAAAARYYSKSILFDPANPQLLERGALAYLSLGQIDRAAALAQELEEGGHSSQVGNMAIVARMGGDEAFEAILARIADNRGVGPLVDGLARAWSQLGQGDMTAALVAFDEVAEEDGLMGFALYHKALALASVGDFESAEAIFADDTMGAMQMTRRGIMARAEIQSQLEKNDAALELIERSFGPDMDPGLRALKAALEAGEALTFSHVTSARDGLAEVFYTLAGALSNEANDDFTLLYSRMAEHLRPGHVDALLLSAELLQQLGQPELATETYRKVPGDHPSYHAAELGRAAALRDSGNDEAAVEVLEQLARTHGDLPVVQSTLGDTMRRLERYSDAVAAYDEALALFEEPAQSQWFLYYARGISHERQSDWTSAEADLRQALELNPDQPQVLNYLGYSLVEKKTNLDEALEMIERAVARRPDSGYIVDSLGWVLYRLGRYDEAVGHMERAAELMPVDPIVNDHLGDVYWAVGRELEAEFQWRRALSFVDFQSSAEDANPDRIRRKIEVGLDAVLAEEGAPPLRVANDDG